MQLAMVVVVENDAIVLTEAQLKEIINKAFTWGTCSECENEFDVCIDEEGYNKKFYSDQEWAVNEIFNELEALKPIL